MMTTTDRIRCGAVLLFLLTLIPSAWAGAEEDVASLRGLRAVPVDVQVSEEATTAGLTPEVARQEIVSRLETAGIEVPPFTTSSPNHLSVSINATPLQGEIFTYLVTVKLYQNASLSRDPKITTRAITWYELYYGQNSIAAIRRLVQNRADSFLKDHRKANPAGVGRAPG